MSSRPLLPRQGGRDHPCEPGRQGRPARLSGHEAHFREKRGDGSCRAGGAVPAGCRPRLQAGDGIPAARHAELLGRQVRHTLAPNHKIIWEDLK